MCEFEKKVKDRLDDILRGDGEQKNSVILPDILIPRACAAVSGGADSIALLLAMSEIFSPLYVITVNHNIRPEAECRGDVDFVLGVCERLRSSGYRIKYEAVELEKGAVAQEAERRGGGIEEAARYLRYKAFENFAAEHKLNVLCTAHTKNDQLETVLMRFLHGSPVEAAGGIREKRFMTNGSGVFARPLLGLTRAEIEAYVTGRGFSWRTDKTNYETDYLRNRIRLKLVPFLDAEFPGWQKSVLSGAEKACEDAELLLSFSEKVPVSVLADEKSGEEKVEISLSAFLSAPAAVQRRVLLSACNKAGETGRIPSQFIKDVLGLAGRADNSNTTQFTKHFACIDIILKKNRLFVKKHSESSTDFVFFDIIEKTGCYEFPFGSLDVFNHREENGIQYVAVCAGDSSTADYITLPFCVRSARLGDAVLSSEGSLKKVSDIFSDWHVVPEKKSLIPVIQLLDEKKQGIKAILGGFLGYKDWIVKL